MPLRDEFSGEGIEALLARTRRQMSIFILGATALIVAVVGVGGAVAGNSALDAGLDNALVARAERIVLEIQEELPPLPTASPGPGESPNPSVSPSESEEPEDSEAPEESEKPEESMKPEDSEKPDDEDEDDSGRAPSVISVAFFVFSGAHRDDAPPVVRGHMRLRRLHEPQRTLGAGVEQQVHIALGDIEQGSDGSKRLCVQNQSINAAKSREGFVNDFEGA